MTTADLGRLRQHLIKQQLKPVTVESYVTLVGSMLRHLGPRSARVPHGLGLIREPPFLGRRLSYSCQVKTPAPLEHLALLYESASEIDYCPHKFPLDRQTFWRAWLVIAYNTGLRFSDISSNLAWSHIDLAERRITITAQKTGKQHLLPINTVLDQHLRSLPTEGESLLGFPRTGFNNMRVALRTHCQRLNIPPIQPQAIRRTAGEVYESAHPGAGGLLLGHALPSSKGTASNITFGHYIRGLETVLRPASEKIPQPWGEETGD